MASEINVKVITYNTHLMADSNLVVGAWVKNKKPVVFLDNHRHNAIVAKIRESKADVVALQEVWAKARMERICNDLKNEYPYSAKGSDGGSAIQYLPALITSGIPDRAAGSGLVLLSKYPISEIGFELFQNPHDDEERAASKGVLTATLQIGSYPVRIGMTHMWTDAGKDCSNVVDLAKHAVSARSPSTLLLGDFNIHRIGNRDKYARLNQIMANFQAEDTWTLKHGKEKDQDSATDDQAFNNLAQFFSPMRDTERVDCIDYAYLASKDGRVTVRDAKVLRDWKVSTNNQTPKWYWVHDGTVGGNPAATAFGPNFKKLCVVSRETSGQLRASICDRATRKWTSTIMKNNGGDLRADGAPGLAWFDGKLRLFFRGIGNAGVVKMESSDGVTWSNAESTGKAQSSGGCCAVVFRNELCLLVRDPTGNQIRYHKWTRGGWSDPIWIGLETDHNISAAALGDRMCVVARDPGQPPGGIMHVYIGADGKADGRRQLAPHATTSGSPSVAAIKGNFWVFYREPDGGGLHCRVSGNGYQHVTTTHQATTDEACAVAWGDEALVFFSKVVYESRKSGVDKVLYPEDSVLYPACALAHTMWESDVALDLSDHYPYQVELTVRVPR